MTLCGHSEADPLQRFALQESQQLPGTVLACALPAEGSDHLLTGINGAGLLSRSNGLLVALQLEKSDLVLPGKKLIPGYINLGRELVILDCEWAGVDHQRFEESGRLCIVCRRLAICRRDDECHVSVRRDERPAFRIATKRCGGVSTDDLNGPRSQLPTAGQLLRCILRESQSRRKIAIHDNSEDEEAHMLPPMKRIAILATGNELCEPFDCLLARHAKSFGQQSGNSSGIGPSLTLLIQPMTSAYRRRHDDDITQRLEMTDLCEPNALANRNDPLFAGARTPDIFVASFPAALCREPRGGEQERVA